MAELKDLFGTGDPEEYRKKLALSLTQQGLDSSPIRSPWQGAARLAQALVGSMQMNDLQSEGANALRDEGNAIRIKGGLPPIDGPQSQSILGMLASKFGGGASGPAGAPAMPAPPAPDAGNYGGSPETNSNLIPAAPSPPPMPTRGLPPPPSLSSPSPGLPPPSPAMNAGPPPGGGGMFGGMPGWAPGEKPMGWDAPAGPRPSLSPPAPTGPLGGPAPAPQPVAPQGGPSLNAGGPMAPPAPMPPQAPPQGVGQPSRGTPQIPPDVLARIDQLTRQGTRAGLQQAQLLAQPYLAPREQYSTINDPQGNPVAQRNSLTNEVKAYPQAERWVPVPDARGNIVGFKNAVTGQPMNNPMAPDNDIIRNPDGTVSFLNKKDPAAGIQSAPGRLPIEQFNPAMSPGGVPAQRSTITGKIDPVPQQGDSIRDVEYAQRNWQSMHLPDPNSADPKDQQFWRDYTTKRLGGSGVNVALSTERKGQEVMATKAAEDFQAAQAAGRAAVRRAPVWDAMEKAAQGFTPGATADLKLQGKRILKDLGVIGDEGISDAETFKMMQQQLAIHNQPTGQGAVSNYEREMFSKSIPNMTLSPEGLQKALQISRKLDAFDRRGAEIYRENAKKNGGVPNPVEINEDIDKLASPLTPAEMNSIQNTGSQGSSPTKIGSKAELDALPRGATFIAPDGSVRTKP